MKIISAELEPSNSTMSPSLQQLEKKLDTFFAQILKSNDMLHKEVIALREEVKVLKSDKIEVNSPEQFISQIKLPAKSQEELANLEALITNNNEECKAFIKKISRVGGIHIRSLVNNMMRFVIQPSVAAEFSLKGKNNKKKFEELKIYECLIGKIFYSSI